MLRPLIRFDQAAVEDSESRINSVVSVLFKFVHPTQTPSSAEPGLESDEVLEQALRATDGVSCLLFVSDVLGFGPVSRTSREWAFGRRGEWDLHSLSFIVSSLSLSIPTHV